MEAIPSEWIDKLFSCMTDFYGDRWTRYFKKPHMETFYKAMWKSGLHGLTYEEIKYALLLCKKASNDLNNFPPYVTEFYRMAKGRAFPYISENKEKAEPYNPEIAHQSLSEIRRKLGKIDTVDAYNRLVK